MAKILLVEDDKSLREIYGVRLMAEGYEIVSAGDGEEALAMAIKERPDLIVSDVMMPKISGFDMLDILRSTSETKEVKVIMMTALSSDDQRARGESLGADRYLVKSQVGIEDVVRTVHDVLGDGIAAPTPAAPTFPASPAPVAAPAPQPTPQPAPAPAEPTPAPVAFAAPAPEPTPAPAATFEAPQPAPTVDPAYAPQEAAPAPQPAPAFEQQPAPAPAPAYEQPAPQPVFDPAAMQPAAPIAPQPAPAAPTAFAQPAPQSTTLSELPPAPAPAPAYEQPAPATAPQPAPAFEQPAPVASEPLPQPTAPFSSPAPASLGERVIEPLTNPTVQQNDIASQMAAALNTQPPQGPQQPPQVPPAQ